MKDMDEALQWLNWESASRLSSSTRFWIDRFDLPTLDSLEREEIVNALERLVKGVFDALEQAEILTFAGAFHFALAHFNEAEIDLTAANNFYEYLDNWHRHAVTTWMLYLVKRAKGDYRQAFDQGKRARAHFLQLANHYRQLGNRNAESWYYARIHDLTAYLVDTPVDMFQWLFEFHGSRLSNSAVQIRDHLHLMVANHTADQAKDDIDALIDITRHSVDCQETGEAFAWCGMAEWQMGKQMSSLYYFRAALSQYLPGSHEYAVLTWVLGLAEIAIPQMKSKAIVTLERGIQRMERLQIQSVEENDHHKRDWYALTHQAMRRVLRKLISE